MEGNVTLVGGQAEIRASAPDEFYVDVPAVWRASVFTLGAVLAIIAVLGIGSIVVDDLSGLPRLAVSIAVAVGPALLWLFLLYRTSRAHEASASPLAATLFVLGALLAAAVTRPILYELIDLNTWAAQASSAGRFTAMLLIGGAWHAFALYATVRYTVWQTPAFTRRTDGVLYGLAYAWGYAAALNLLFVLDNNGLTLLDGNLRLLTQPCSYLAAGAVMGYFLGKNRFEVMPFYFLPVGQVTIIGLIGLMSYIGIELNSIRLGLTQDGFSPWGGLIVNLLLLVLTITAAYGIIQRENALTQARLGLQT
jgi:RsiW-degrading membrane proteinase PrsW (M82 family)